MGLALYRNLVAPSSVPATAFTIIQCPSGTSPVSDSISDTLTLAVGSSGTDFSISGDSTTDTVTFHIPDASATARGLVTTGTQSFAGQKSFNTGIRFPNYDIGESYGPSGEFTLEQDGSSLQFEFVDHNVDASNGFNFIRVDLVIGNHSFLKMNSTESVFNDDSKDRDFRVESDGNANMIFVDASTNRVGIGTGSPAVTLDVSGAATVRGNLTITTPNDLIVNGGETTFGSVSYTWPGSLVASSQQFLMSDLSGNLSWQNWQAMPGRMLIDGSADVVQFTVQAHSVQSNLLAIFENSAGTDQVTITSSGSVVINEAGNAVTALRVEGDTDVNCLVVASNDRVGVGVLAPAAFLNIKGGTTSVAPLRLDKGVLLSSKLSGVFEFDTSLYHTNFQDLRYCIGGAIKDFTSDVGNVGTGEDDLYSFTTIASTLAATGEKITAKYGGTMVASATDTRQIKVYFAGTVILDTGAITTAANSSWEINVMVIRTGTSTARSIVSFFDSGASVTNLVTETDITSLTFTNSNILKITGESAGVSVANNDIVAKLGAIWWHGLAP